MLFPATEDRLHQDARAHAYPDSHHLVVALREATLPAVISGAGPTVLAFTTDEDERAAAAGAAPPGCQSLVVPVDTAAARLHIRGS